MPYIKPERRNIVWDLLQPEDAGELNFLITRIINEYWEYRPRYQTIAEITGVLENVKQEFYRRIATPYEEQKIKENGDVY